MYAPTHDFVVPCPYAEASLWLLLPHRKKAQHEIKHGSLAPKPCTAVSCYTQLPCRTHSRLGGAAPVPRASPPATRRPWERRCLAFLAHGFSAADAGRCGGGGAAEGIALAQELEEDAGRCGDGGAAEGFALAEELEEEEDDDDADDVDFFLGCDDGPEGGRTAVSRATLSHRASLRWPVLVRASPPRYFSSTTRSSA